MRLVDIPDNPIPPGSVVHAVSIGPVTLRVARWDRAAGVEGRGTVAILPGRSEFIEKYAEVVAELLARGFAVTVLDWRGQGGSSRLLRDPRKGHVRHFDEYRADLDALALQVLQPHCPRPWFALAHSMGGAVVVDHAARGPSLFDRIVLSAPMFDLYDLRMAGLVRGIAASASLAGLGPLYIPGGSHRSWMAMPFDGNRLTSDERRFSVFGALARAAPELLLGAPTMGWLHAALRIMGRIGGGGFPARIEVPVLAVAAGVDRVVATAAVERFAAETRHGHCIVVPHALHEILMERDVMRRQFWAGFDAFVPGSG